MSKTSIKYGVNLNTNYTTKKGTAVFPKLIEPDTKFNKSGVYSTKMRFEKADEEDLIALLTPLAETALAEARKEEKNKTLKLAAFPWKPEVEKEFDEEGNVVSENPTGNMLFNFKLNAEVKSKKTGKIIKFAPKLFNSANPPTRVKPDGLNIGGGSALKISFTVRPFYIAKDKEVGLTLQIDGVQIINLVQYGTKSAAELGFGAEEGGYSETGSEVQVAPGMPSAGSDDASDSDDEF